MSDDDLRRMWREAGGEFYGPNVETGRMPERELLVFLRAYARSERARTIEECVAKIKAMRDDYHPPVHGALSDCIDTIRALAAKGEKR